MKLKKIFLIVLLSVSLIANSCIRSYAFIGLPSIAAGAVISVLSSWGLTFVFNGQSFSESVNYIGDLLDEWGGDIDFSGLGISTGGALVVGSAIYNGLRNFADWLVDKFSVSDEGSYIAEVPEVTNSLLVGSGLSLASARTAEAFNTSGTLVKLGNYNSTLGFQLSNGYYLRISGNYNASGSSDRKYSMGFCYTRNNSSTYFARFGSDANTLNAINNGFKFCIYYSNLCAFFINSSGAVVDVSLTGAQGGFNYLTADLRGAASVDVGGIAIDAQNVSIPDTDIDENNAGLFTLTNISALIGSYARDLSSIMDDVLNRALTVNNYNTVVNTGSVASTLAAAETVEAVEDIDIAVTDPLPPPSGEDMQLSLSSVFPFCLPFDLYNFFACLAAAPVTPSFDVEIAGTELHADAHALDSYAPVFRKFILLGYVVTLIVNTKKLLRGDS